MLKTTGLNFVGNVEGGDLFNGTVDVIVCDGFVGNVVLKSAEALAEFILPHAARGDRGEPARQARLPARQARLRPLPRAHRLQRVRRRRRCWA